MEYNYTESEPTMVNEAASVYLRQSGQAVSSNYTFLEFLKDKMLVVQSIQKGITQSFFDAIRMRMPFSDQEWADFFNVSLKSLQRYKSDPGHVYKPILSEKIVQMAEVMEEGARVFGNEGSFYRWLDTPSMALGGMRPKALLKDAYGQRMVMAELHAIDHGIFA